MILNDTVKVQSYPATTDEAPPHPPAERTRTKLWCDRTKLWWTLCAQRRLDGDWSESTRASNQAYPQSILLDGDLIDGVSSMIVTSRTSDHGDRQCGKRRDRQ
jgi:hypothetical protein